MYLLKRALEKAKKSKEGVASGDVAAGAFKPGPVNLDPTKKDLQKYVIAALRYLNNGDDL